MARGVGNPRVNGGSRTIEGKRDSRRLYRPVERETFEVLYRKVFCLT